MMLKGRAFSGKRFVLLGLLVVFFVVVLASAFLVEPVDVVF